MKFRKIKRYLNDPFFALGCDLLKYYPNCMSDKYYIKTLWRMIMGTKLNLKNPRTFNEKLQWLKLYDRNPIYTSLVDKLLAKEIISGLIGEQYIVPTLAIYSSVDEIDIGNLPEQFVLKCNHDSGSVFLCQDKRTFDLAYVKEKLRKSISYNYYWKSREWPYKDIKPKIFAETFLKDDEFADLVTYKFLCFNGSPQIMYATVKNEDIWENFYDMNFNPLSIKHGRRTCEKELKKPSCFEEMINIVKILSQNIPHVRVDLYEVSGKVYFSEYTFYDWGGLMKFDDESWDEKLGHLIQLPIHK